MCHADYGALMPVNGFGGSRLGPVHSVTLGSPPGPVLELLDLGATVHRLWVTGGDGVRRNVVLGYGTAEEYLEGSDCLGATVGRYANRIADGRFPLDGRTVQLATNEGGHTLHGGPEGFHRRIWDILEVTERSATLGLVSPDGDQGFPGRLAARVRLAVVGDEVKIGFEATTDAATVVNLTNHCYFNLDGEAAGSVEGHRLAIAAEAFIPVDAGGIPTHGPMPVAGTPFDLRRASRLGDRLHDEHAQVARAGGFDHTFVVGRRSPADRRPVASLESCSSGTRLEVRTDQPGLQVYTGNALGQRSAGPTVHSRWGGVALEPQLWPDSPNRPDFESAVLRPGETYRAELSWKFGRFDPDTSQ